VLACVYFAEEKKSGKSIRNLGTIIMLSDNKEFIDFLEDVSRNMKPETMDKIKTLLKGSLTVSCVSLRNI
jgi:hypothetical protein